MKEKDAKLNNYDDFKWDIGMLCVMYQRWYFLLCVCNVNYVLLGIRPIDYIWWSFILSDISMIKNVSCFWVGLFGLYYWIDSIFRRLWTVHSKTIVFGFFFFCCFSCLERFCVSVHTFLFLYHILCANYYWFSSPCAASWLLKIAARQFIHFWKGVIFRHKRVQSLPVSKFFFFNSWLLCLCQ